MMMRETINSNLRTIDDADKVITIQLNKLINHRDVKGIIELSQIMLTQKFKILGSLRGESTTIQYPGLFNSRLFQDNLRTMGKIGNEAAIKFISQNFQLNMNAAIFGAAEGYQENLLNQLVEKKPTFNNSAGKRIKEYATATSYGSKGNIDFYNVVKNYQAVDCALAGAAFGGHDDLAFKFINKDNLNIAMIFAMENWHIRLISRLLARGADIEKAIISAGENKQIAEKLTINSLPLIANIANKEFRTQLCENFIQTQPEEQHLITKLSLYASQLNYIIQANRLSLEEINLFFKKCKPQLLTFCTQKELDNMYANFINRVDAKMVPLTSLWTNSAAPLPDVSCKGLKR